MIRRTLERFFERLALLVTKKPLTTISLLALLIILSGVGLKKIQSDPSIDSFFLEGDQSYQNYQAFKEQYGSDARVILLFEPKDIFDIDFLNKLKSLHHQLEENVPYLDEVTSMINITVTTGKGDELIVQDLFEDWPTNQTELDDIKQQALSIPSWRGNLFNADGTQTTLTILADVYAEEGGAVPSTNGFDQFKTPSLASPQAHSKTRLTVEQTDEFVNAILSLYNQYNTEDFPIYIAGGPVMDQSHVQIIRQVMSSSFGGVFVIILLMLAVLFRRVSGVLLPLSVIIFTVVTSYGLFGWAGIKMTLISQIAPGLLLSFSVTDSVHILANFYKRYRSSEQKRDALVAALKHASPAVLFTSVTTAVGFATFWSASVKAVAELAIIVPIGVFMALVFTLAMMPAIIMVCPIKPLKAQKSKSRFLLPQIGKLAAVGYQHPYAVCGITLALTFASFGGIHQLYGFFNPVQLLPNDHFVKLNTLHIDNQMGASQALEMVIDTGTPNGLYNPLVQDKLEQLNNYAETLSVNDRGIPLSISIVDILKQINRSLHGNNPDYYRVPDTQEAIAQEILLFENGGSEDLEKLVDTELSKARVSIYTPNDNSLEYLPLISALETKANALFAGLATVTVTGAVKVNATMLSNMMSSLQSGYFLAAVMISVMMIIFLMRIKVGLASMLPNFFPIVVTLGLMGYLGISITPITLLIGAVALGIAVDDTAHFMFHFQKHMAATQHNVVQSVQNTLEDTGQAILFTTLIMTCGFSVFMLAPLEDVRYFGLAMAFCMMLALLTDLMLIPAIAMIFHRKQIRSNTHRREAKAL